MWREKHVGNLAWHLHIQSQAENNSKLHTWGLHLNQNSMASDQIRDFHELKNSIANVHGAHMHT